MTNQEIDNAVESLKKGGLILYPTDTIWGIGCDPFNIEAVEGLFQLKKRTRDKHFILLVDSMEMLRDYIENIPKEVQSIIIQHKEPTTIIYPSSKVIHKEISTTDGSLAIRIVKDAFCSALINRFGKPIISSSSNITGEASPSCFKEINDRILKGVDYIVNLRQEEDELHKPSKILCLHDDNSFSTIRE